MIGTIICDIAGSLKAKKADKGTTKSESLKQQNKLNHKLVAAIFSTVQRQEKCRQKQKESPLTAGQEQQDQAGQVGEG